VIAIVDACSGNLRSVARALARAGGAPIITSDAAAIRRADKIVVPGQGAFSMFMRGLAERGLGEAVREVIARGRPYLGICLGLQVLFERSEEHGETRGLGVLAGSVVALTPTAAVKVPHIGWNRVAGSEPLLTGLAPNPYFYFVHSYHAVPVNRDIVTLTVEHGAHIVAAVRKDNIFACQFHPEKSQRAGLSLLANFVASAR
jgi:glutamine amidotransferase